MQTDTLTHGAGIALNFSGEAAPDWVQLLPRGPEIVGADGRAWYLTSAEEFVAAFNRGQRRPVDVEHATEIKAPKGEPAPAVGWVEELQARPDGVWGRIAWNAEGARLVTTKAYRYLSPAFLHDGAGGIRSLRSVGLTNSPNLDLAALNRTDTPTQETEMDANVLEALGLKPTATAADALTAIATLKDARDVALNRAATPDPEKFVPKADHQLALNRIATFEAEAKARHEVEIVAAVEAAVADGKIAPAQKDYHLATCRAEGGLDRFKAMVAASPKLLAPSGIEQKPVVSGEDKASFLAMNTAQQTAHIGAKARELIAAEKAKGVDLELGIAINRVMETLK